jgi:tRNA nucleotidyltransferase (CCA-adding enzyme)
MLLATSDLLKEMPGLVDAQPSEVVGTLDKAPRIAIYAVYLVTKDKNLRDLLWCYVSKWAEVEPKTTGDDLRNMGLRPSPAYGHILSALRAAWLDGEVHSYEEEQVLLNQLISQYEQT